MGYMEMYRCADCGTDWLRTTGMGMAQVYQLHCDRCGDPTSVDFSQWRPSEPLESELDDDDDWYTTALVRHVEEAAGGCECGGHFRVDAPPICPECRSTNIDPDAPSGMMGLWD